MRAEYLNRRVRCFKLVVPCTMVDLEDASLLCKRVQCVLEDCFGGDMRDCGYGGRKVQYVGDGYVYETFGFGVQPCVVGVLERSIKGQFGDSGWRLSLPDAYEDWRSFITRVLEGFTLAGVYVGEVFGMINGYGDDGMPVGSRGRGFDELLRRGCVGNDGEGGFLNSGLAEDDVLGWSLLVDSRERRVVAARASVWLKKQLVEYAKLRYEEVAANDGN